MENSKFYNGNTLECVCGNTATGSTVQSGVALPAWCGSRAVFVLLSGNPKTGHGYFMCGACGRSSAYGEWLLPHEEDVLEQKLRCEAVEIAASYQRIGHRR